MNLFRSEEHARKWSGFEVGTEDGVISLRVGASIMSTPRHRERLSGHYVSSVAENAPIYFANLRKLTNNSPFWMPPGG